MKACVSIVPCESYQPETVRRALSAVLEPIGGLDFVKPGMKIVIKANLVSAKVPETAATTHPVLVSVLCQMLTARGASVVVGDSPGGLYNAPVMNRNYSVTGMRQAEEYGAVLNQNFEKKIAHSPASRVLKTFTYTAYLDWADVIIDFCKLKSHGMMTLSGAAKNMFGVIPGTIKPEYHYLYPDYNDFADMLVDLDEFFHPVLSIVDAVVAMEGNGPTAGTPKKIGALVASQSPHAADLLCAALLGLRCAEVPTLAAAYRRELIPAEAKELQIFGDWTSFVQTDFNIVTKSGSLTFNGQGKNRLLNFGTDIAGWMLRSTPQLKKSMCVGCNVCGETCPADAIKMENGKAVIDRKRCIRCFCCQEFCPKGAMQVHRTPVARLIGRM